MPKCIVCKGHYDSDTVCERCQSDNAPWTEWRRNEPAEQGGVPGLLLFAGLPLYVTILALALGLIFVDMAWRGIKFTVSISAIAVTVVLSLVIIYWVYDERHKLRENELLAAWKATTRKREGQARLDPRLKTTLIATVVLVSILLLAYALIKLETPWAFLKWLFLEPTGAGGQAGQPSQLAQKVLEMLPLAHLVGYAVLSTGLICFLSRLSLRTYAKRLNRAVPHPIFLQGDLLAKVVRREAEVELGRLDPTKGAPEGANISGMGYLQFEERTNPQLLRLPASVDMSAAIQGPLSPQVELWWQAANWVWDELGRTDDGGIEMRVAREEIYQLPKPTEGSGHTPHPRVRYVVRADRWGRITKIKRDQEVQKK